MAQPNIFLAFLIGGIVITTILSIWLSSFVTTASQSADAQLNSTLSNAGLRIEGISGSVIYVRNTGSGVIEAFSVTAFVDGSPAGDCPSSSAAPGSIFSCSLNTACDSIISVKAQGASDQLAC